MVWRKGGAAVVERRGPHRPHSPRQLTLDHEEVLMIPSPHRGVSPSDVDTSGPRSLRIGRYELIAQLAQGGMGTVYLARIAGEAGFSRLYAVKLMHEHLAS